MTSPNGSKGSPLRVGGLALLGVGVVAGALGLIGVNSGNEVTPVAAPSLSTSAAPPAAADPAAPAESPAPAPPAAEVAPPAAAAPSSAAAPAPGGPTTAAQAPAPAPPPAPAAAPAPGAAGSADAARATVRVYNNSTVAGLAERAASDFRNAGWTVDQVDNYSSGTIQTSTVYYRPGTGEQSSAQRLGTEFGLRSEPRFAGLTNASPGLIIIVTKDYQQR